MAEAIGWFSALALLITMGQQVYQQWRSDSVSGVSRWLFIGQMIASLGFTAYSVLLKNWVFTATNGLMIVSAIIGQGIFLMKKRRTGARDAGAADQDPASAGRRQASEGAASF